MGEVQIEMYPQEVTGYPLAIEHLADSVHQGHAGAELINSSSMRLFSHQWEGVMRRFLLLVSFALAFIFSALFVADPALADKPSQAGAKGAEIPQ